MSLENYLDFGSGEAEQGCEVESRALRGHLDTRYALSSYRLKLSLIKQAI